MARGAFPSFKPTAEVIKRSWTSVQRSEAESIDRNNAKKNGTILVDQQASFNFSFFRLHSISHVFFAGGIRDNVNLVMF